MVTNRSADRPAAVIMGGRLSARQSLLDRKLSRRNPADFARVGLKTLLIRVGSAATCFVSMLLVAWIGAFVRLVSAQHGRVFNSLNGATLFSVSEHAGKYEVQLLLVLISWALLLLLTPAGFTIAFRAAAGAAGILGYLHFSPPLFRITAATGPISDWLARFDGYWSRHAVIYIIFSTLAACLLQSTTVRIFSGLDHLPVRAGLGFNNRPDYFSQIRRLSAAALALLILLLVIWAATVLRLASAQTGTYIHGSEYGFQGGLYQSQYLFILVLLAILVTQADFADKWLAAAAFLGTLYLLSPKKFTVPEVLEISWGRGFFAHAGTAWGADTPRVALFLFIPASICGIYLFGKMLRSP
jgi:hypothetical protein